MTILDQSINAARALSLTRAKSMVDLHPELFNDRVHMMTVKSGEVTTYAPYSYLQALQDYECYVWVRKAITLLANNFASVPVLVATGGELNPNHDISKLLTNVNDQMSSGDLWQQWVVDMMLGGEEAWELIKTGNAYSQIWPRQPHTVNVIPDRQMLRYHQVAEYVIDDAKGPPYKLPPEELAHFKFYNPRNPWRGLSPISAIRQSIAIDQLAQAWSRMFFRNSARPDYALITPAGTTESERVEIEKKLMAKYGGTDNAGKPIILEEGITDIKMLSWPPKDMEYIEQKQMSREEIGAIFGVPDGLMGWGQESYDTATKIDGDMRALWVVTLVPLISYRDTRLTEFFQGVGALGADERIVSDLSGVAVLKKDVSALAGAFTSFVNAGYPINIVNQTLGLGFPEVDGGDVGYIPFGLQPATSAKGKAQGGLVDPSKPLFIVSRSGEATVTTRRMFKAPDFGSPEHKSAWMQKDTRLDKERKRMKKQLAEEFERQQREVKRRLQQQRGVKVNANGNGHAIPDPEEKAPKASDVFDLKAEIKRFEKEFEEVIADALQRAGQDELDGLGIDIDFDLDRPEVREALEDLLDEFATKTNETTYSNLKDLFKRAELEGLSIPDIQNELDTYFGGRRSDASTERIARTTMTGANGAGDVTAWEQSGVVEEREWLAALDDRTRDDHREAHGQRVGLDEPFDVGGEELDHPGDPKGSAEQIIHCRCSQIAIVSERSLRRAGKPRRQKRELATRNTEQEGMLRLLVELVARITQPQAAPAMSIHAEHLAITAGEGGINMGASEVKVMADNFNVPLMPAPKIEVTNQNIVNVPRQDTPDIIVQPSAVNIDNIINTPVTPLAVTVTQERKSAKIVHDGAGRPMRLDYEDTATSGPVTKAEDDNK